MTESMAFDLDVADAERPGQSWGLRVEGQLVVPASPADMHWTDVLVAGHDPIAWVATAVAAEHRDLLARVAVWKVETAAAAWRTAYGLCRTAGEDRRLAALVRAYGQAIERDLAPQHDLVAEWQARRWRRLLNLVDGLPRASAYVEALSQDDAYAEQMLDEPSPARRLMREWTPEVELLSLIADRQAELAMVIAATRGGKSRQIQPQPRPKGAFDRVRKKRSEARHRKVTAKLLPHKAAEMAEPA